MDVFHRLGWKEKPHLAATFSGRTAGANHFGPTEEDGIAVEPDGRALITSVGVHGSASGFTTSAGIDHSLRRVKWSGRHLRLFFNPDASIIYYLLRRAENSDAELWRTVVDSGKSDAVFPGISMIDFDVSPDGNEVVYATAARDGTTQLWRHRWMEDSRHESERFG